jgi:hypothetical protein
LVKNFREELLNELLQLVEVVLVQKQNEIGVGQIEKGVLESRLAAILNPANIKEDNTKSLAIVDAYLADKTG